MENLEIIHDLDRIRAAVTEVPGRFPRSELALNRLPYHRAIWRENVGNNSLLIADQGTPLAVMVSASTSGSYKYFAQPAHLEFMVGGLAKNVRTDGLRLFGKYVDKNLSTRSGISISYSKESTNVDGFEGRLLSHGASSTSRYQVVVDLKQAPDKLTSGFSSSHRQSIRQGSKTFGVPNIYYKDIEERTFHNFQNLHLKVAGKVTRPQESWDAMLTAIFGGEAVLVTYEANATMIGGSFIWLSRAAAEYGTGVYDRELFTTAAVSHNLVYRSMEFSQRLGCQTFIVGSAYETGGTDKERSIAQFKRGFTRNPEPLQVLELHSRDVF